MKFAEHFNQATLFYNSQTEAERHHIAAAFRFELSKVTVPAVRSRVVSMLRNASDELAAEVAAGLGMQLPEPMPRALEETPAPEVEVSPALSLTARPGEAGIQTRKIAIMIADGIDGEAVWQAAQALQEQGAIVRLVGPHIGAIKPETGELIDADASLENHPGVLFDGVIVPGGRDAAKLFATEPKAREFLSDQFLHCKTIWASRDSEMLLRQAGITAQDETLPGMFVTEESTEKALMSFISAVGRHRHFERSRAQKGSDTVR